MTSIFSQPSKVISQALVWTALPQGAWNPPGAWSSTGSVRLSVLVHPQLSFTETVGFRTEESTELASFADWVNWPQTVSNPNGQISFQVVFTTPGGVQHVVKALPDLSVLRPDCWAAMFGPTTTRVDSFGFTDFSHKKVNTFDAYQAHSDVLHMYNSYAGNSAQHNAKAGINPGPYVDPSQISLSDVPILSGSNPDVPATTLTKIPSPVPANVAVNALLEPTNPAATAVGNVLAFHKAQANDTSIPVPTVPILDFHAGISSLGHFPELLRYFGLAFALELSLPDAVAEAIASAPASSPVTVAVVPSWTRVELPGVPSCNVLLLTACGPDFQVPPSDPSLYTNGSLNLQNGIFNVVDFDVDRAAHALNSSSKNLSSTYQLHKPPPGSNPPLAYKLPALHNAGLSLIWTGWGRSLTDLAARQSALNTAISAALTSWLELSPDSRPTELALSSALYLEDVTRGWRIDVLDDSDDSKEWRSLHWRLATYTFGAESEITLQEPTLHEGMLTPTASHAAQADGSVPDEIDVHEMIARWVGWSLSAPRPGGQVQDDGSVSVTAQGNLAVPTSYTDEYGNYNPQVSATFTSPPAGLIVLDPVSGGDLGTTTGLPTLRFGHTYQLAARAVDLAGWSIPPSVIGTGLVSASPKIVHSRWEPIRAPTVVPVAPLTPGEGVHTIVIRMDERGVPATPSARWLFPPKVHERLAEEHSSLDSGGLPDPSLYATLTTLADGTVTTLRGPDPNAPKQLIGATQDPSGNWYYPFSLPAQLDNGSFAGFDTTAPEVSWLPDPAAAGYALFFEAPPGLDADGAVAASPFTGEAPFASFDVDTAVYGDNQPELPNPSPVLIDLWSYVPPVQEPQQWPHLRGRLLVVAPFVPGSAANPYGGTQAPGGSGVVIPAVLDIDVADKGYSPAVLPLGLTPGSVYQVRLSSIIPPAYADGSEEILGLLPYARLQITKFWDTYKGTVRVVGRPPSPVPEAHAQDTSQAPLYAFLFGQVPQLTPYHTLQLVYAVRVPLLAPSFSDKATFFRAPNDITVTISDPSYVVDIPTTSTVTWTATWTDPVDDPSDPTNDPANDTTTVIQGALVASVSNIYDDPIAADPMVPGTTPLISNPFGTITFNDDASATGQTGTLAATHRIGDTKHHFITYTPVATSRFGAFFSTTVTVTLEAGQWHTLDQRGIDVNLVTVRVAATSALVEPAFYDLDGPNGQIRLAELFGTATLHITYAPTDTLAGPPYQPTSALTDESAITNAPVTLVSGGMLDGADRPAIGTKGAPTPVGIHIPSTMAPPAVKVAKVAPAWSLSSTGTPGTAGYSYTRTGNMLRVYLERPWWVTGANEMLGVLVAAHDSSDPLLEHIVGPGGSTTAVSADDVTLLAIDPISVAYPGARFSQSQLSLITPTPVPSSGGPTTVSFPLAAGNPVRVPSALDPLAESYDIYGYVPSYDSVTGMWYADIRLDMDSFENHPPPGYFVRLALARFQPFSISRTSESFPPSSSLTCPPGYVMTAPGVCEPTAQQEPRYLSPTTLVTYAQPVSDRSVTAVVDPDGSIRVTVRGPAYYGFRPAPFAVEDGAIVPNPTEPWVHDRYNNYAEHPNSDGAGTRATSTMIVELQQYDDSDGFSGDFGWKTRGQVTLQPDLDGSAVVNWTTTTDATLHLPPSVARSSLRLRISELDYFPFKDLTPTAIDTTWRRPFVAHIPL